MADLLLFGSALAWMIITLRLRYPVSRRPPGQGVSAMLTDATAIAGGLLMSFLMMRWLHVLVVGVTPLP